MIGVPAPGRRRPPLTRWRGEAIPLRALRGGVPRRHREPDNVRTHPGAPRRNRLGQRHRRPGEQGQVRYDPAKGGQSSGMGRRRASFPDPSAHVLPAESDRHARSHSGGAVEIRRNQVVEEAVQVRQGGVEQHPRHGRGDALAVHDVLRRCRGGQERALGGAASRTIGPIHIDARHLRQGPGPRARPAERWCGWSPPRRSRAARSARRRWWRGRSGGAGPNRARSRPGAGRRPPR